MLLNFRKYEPCVEAYVAFFDRGLVLIGLFKSGLIFSLLKQTLLKMITVYLSTYDMDAM